MWHLDPVLGNFFGGWEIVLILTVVLILLAIRFTGLGGGLMRGTKEFRKATDEATEDLQRIGEAVPERSPLRKMLTVFIAKGFGVGWIPFAPGTFGSLLGIGWFSLLVWTGSIWGYLGLAIEGIAFSIWLCDDAEKILNEKDPGSVVLDEIIAMPFCFLPWVLIEWTARGHVMPPVETFFSGRAWLWTAGVFVLFRVFDIWKPWPIRQLQRLPGGWGVTVDDVLAAVYVGAVTYTAYCVFRIA